MCVCVCVALQLLSLQDHAEVVEDFVRNYLVGHGLFETAEVFQREWYKGSRGSEPQHLPHVYAQ